MKLAYLSSLSMTKDLYLAPREAEEVHKWILVSSITTTRTRKNDNSSRSTRYGSKGELSNNGDT